MLILRTRYEDGVHRVRVPGKKQYIYWRDPKVSGMCSPNPHNPHGLIAGYYDMYGTTNILQNLERNEASQSNVHAHDALKGAISADDPRASVQASELSF
jgi:hypothetical protein